MEGGHDFIITDGLSALQRGFRNLPPYSGNPLPGPVPDTMYRYLTGLTGPETVRINPVQSRDVALKGVGRDIRVHKLEPA